MPRCFLFRFALLAYCVVYYVVWCGRYLVVSDGYGSVFGAGAGPRLYGQPPSQTDGKERERAQQTRRVEQSRAERESGVGR